MKKWTRLLFATLLALMCATTMLMPVCAAGTTSVSLPVTVELGGPLPTKAEDINIVIQASNAAPLPAGAEDGKYTLTISGKAKTNSATFPTIAYDTVGIYDYTIYQIPGTNKRCTYDKQVYYARVYITNNPDMTALETTVVIYTESPDKDQAEKADALVFKNKYASDPDSPQTGDDSTPLLYAGLIAGSIAVLVVLACTRKPKYSDEE